MNLCTTDKTYRIRQVQSSNSIHVIHTSDNRGRLIPLIRPHADPEEDDSADMSETETVTAIAKCGSTLEVNALSDEECLVSAKQMLGRRLRVYDVEMNQANGDGDGDGTMVKQSIFEDLPFADSQCENAWTELCAFVDKDYSRNSQGMKEEAFRPSARVKLELWRRILEGCILQSIDLEKQFLVRDVWKAVLGEDGDDKDSGFSKPLFDAVIRRLAEQSTESEFKCLSSPLSTLLQSCNQHTDMHRVKHGQTHLHQMDRRDLSRSNRSHRQTSHRSNRVSPWMERFVTGEMAG